MTSEPHEDPEILARLKLTGNDGEEMTYGEIAEELGVSQGTISLRMRKYQSEISQYSADDFTPDRLSSPHTEDQKDIMIGAVMESLPSDAEVGATRSLVSTDDIEVHIPGNYLEDTIEKAVGSDVDDVYVAVYISNVNNEVVSRFKELDIGLVVCKPGKAVVRFSESDYFDGSFITP